MSATVSIGVALLEPSTKTWEEFFEKADKVVYASTWILSVRFRIRQPDIRFRNPGCLLTGLPDPGSEYLVSLTLC